MENQVPERLITDQFLTSIEIHNLANIGDLTIDLSKISKKHLIITGRNGSGKTTFLNSLRYFLSTILGPAGESYLNLEAYLDENPDINTNNPFQENKENYRNSLIKNHKVFANFSYPRTAVNALSKRSFIFTSFQAKRISKFNRPKSISVNNLHPNVAPEDTLRNTFLQYIVNRKAQQSFARDDNDLITVEQTEQWFKNFELQLKILFEDQDLRLIFDRVNFNFKIRLKNKISFDFNQMSDGYAAVFTIITELILRMESYGRTEFDLPGVILIDEIETHLHVDLQKQILPFLTAFFPNIQFLVSTHSPFVITSLKESIICDLEKKIIVNDLTAYSYDAIIESYYNSDKYSEELKNNLNRYEHLLSNISILTETENNELFELSKYFDGVPKHLAKELQMKLIQLDLDYRK